MKRVISLVLIISMVLSLNSNVYAASDQSASDLSDNMIEFLQTDNYKYLVSRNNYAYMNFTENFNSNIWSLLLLGMANVYIDTGEKPDVDKYMECLINLIVTRDMDCAGDVFEQKKMDNLKAAKDYGMDVFKMGKDALSVITNVGKNITPFEAQLSSVVELLSTAIDNTDAWIEEISKLETIVQDYSEHDDFLRVIEENSEGDLKKASNNIRTALKKSMELRLQMHIDVAEENVINIEEYFFTNMFFDFVKEVPEYEKDPVFEFYVDACDNVVSYVDTFFSAKELGYMIGTLAGDIIVGGENLINRVLEMMAIYDISNIIQDEVFKIGQDFFTNTNKIENVSKFINMSNYLVGCRVRGEYCIHSIIVRDAGLLSKFNNESVEDAKKAYDFKVNKMKDIQYDLMRIIECNNEKRTILKDGQYEYSNGQFLSIFEFNGTGQACLYFWHNYGASSSDEDFFFNWVDGQYEYELKGERANKMFNLKFVPTENGVKISVVCTEGTYYSWEEPKESEVWSDVEYTFYPDEKSTDKNNEFDIDDLSAICDLVQEHYNTVLNTDVFVVFETESTKTSTGYEIVLRTTGRSEANVLVGIVNVNTSTGEVKTDSLDVDSWYYK